MDNNDGYFNRRACQRCHAQKLACRPETEDKCLRCIKAGAECIPRSPLRVRKSSNVTKHRGSYSHRNNSIGETSDNNVPTRSATKTSDLMESSERGHSSSSSSKSNNTRKNSSESRDSTTNSENTYPSITSPLQWFPDMMIPGLDFSNPSSSMNLAFNIEDHTTWPTNLETGDFIFNSGDDLPKMGSSKQGLALTDFNMTSGDTSPTTEGNASYVLDKAEWIEELAKLNGRLSKHDRALTLYSQEASGSSLRSSPIEHSSDSPGTKHLDDTLTLTADLIGLLDKLAPQEEGKAPELQNATFHNIFQKVSLDVTMQNTDFVSSSKEIAIPNSISGDPFAILLFMSCYMLLLDTYKLLFARIHTIVTERGPQAASPLLTHFQLPTVIVGPFALRPTPHLEIMLIMEVVNFVIGHIGNTARLLTPTTIVGDEDLQQKGKGSTCKGSNSMDHIIVCMLSSVEKREKELTQAIRDFRETLEQTGTGNNIGFVF